MQNLLESVQPIVMVQGLCTRWSSILRPPEHWCAFFPFYFKSQSSNFSMIGMKQDLWSLQIWLATRHYYYLPIPSSQKNFTWDRSHLFHTASQPASQPANQPTSKSKMASKPWNHLESQKIAGHKLAGMTWLVCVLLSWNTIISWWYIAHTSNVLQR